MSEEGNPFQDVPENVMSLIERVGWADVSNEEHKAVLEERCKVGKCMTCEGSLGQQTILVIDTVGIITAYCTPPCFQDMSVLDWLSETYDDIVQQVKFRGGQIAADEPEEE